MIYYSSLNGSTGADLFMNRTDNKKWVIKKSKKSESGYEQVLLENVANNIYEKLGIPVPTHYLDTKNRALILKYIDGKLLRDATFIEYEKAKKELQQGFIIDALIANWDVIGLTKDNIIIPDDGSAAVRIDNGGTFTLKATGGKKMFNMTVIEIDTMRNKKISPQAFEIFGDLSNADIDNQIKTLIVPNYDLILSLTPEDIKLTMKSRLDYLVEKTIWTNASKFKNDIKEISQPEYIPKIEKAIVEYFKDYWLKNNTRLISKSLNRYIIVYINNVLKDYNVIIGGGFILKAIGSFIDEKSVDMDLYVPTKHIEKFKETMTKIFKPEKVEEYKVSNVPSSFFLKNGILSVTKYSKNIPKYSEMDIVEINDDRFPSDVIKNSDLTFCENWYDGKNIFMTYPEHVEKKNGFLENHYLSLLYSGNPILIKRMKKYIERGFKININDPISKNVKDITNDIINNKIFTEQIKNQSDYITKLIANREISNDKLNMISSYIKNNKNNVSYNLSLLNNKNNIILFDLSVPITKNINNIDIRCIRDYSGQGYLNLNIFLYTDKNIEFKKNILYNLLSKKHPKNIIEKIELYNKRLYYYYFVNLYNAIQKGPLLLTKIFKVYRGTSKLYLEKDIDKMYYINSFTSTTITKEVAKRFNLNNIYIFYIFPGCRYMNIGPISIHKTEDEILFTPYHRYYFIGESGVYRSYIILPTDLDIPNTFDMFLPWKNNITKLSVNHVRNGGAIINQTGPFFNINSSGLYKSKNNTFNKRKYYTNSSNLYKSKNNTLKKLKSNSRLMNIQTPNIKTIPNNIKSMSNNTKLISKNNTIKVSNNSFDTNLFHRLTDPLPSFSGKPPTLFEMDIINKMKKLIENDKE